MRNRRAAASASVASPLSAASRSAGDGRVQQPVGERRGELLEHLFRRVAGGELAPRLGERRVARGLGLVAQLADDAARRRAP